MNAQKNLIDVRGVSKTFTVKSGTFFRKAAASTKAVNNVSLTIRKGEILGCVGGSGSGKSTLGRMIMRLIEPDDGAILFDGTDLRTLSPEAMRQYRKRLQIVFQDPLQSLNPRRTVAENIARPLMNFGTSPAVANRRVDELLELVGLDPRQSYRYPHEYSGGQCQRIAIARALALEPEFLFLDEPVSALDVSIQAQILNLLSELQKKLDLTFLFVSHDLKIVKQFCDRTVVMYRGCMLETGTSEEVYRDPKHPFTRDFLGTVLHVRKDSRWEQAAERAEDLESATRQSEAGCIYAGTCADRFQRCREAAPALTEIEGARHVACHLYSQPKQ
ncbi:ATP-binding cassette domain-containing protein [Pararhizobium sp. YC-54]|uniref:oligopeptide/dipeptide ABC transporter ATP-binding protein n=1 Tax=Pararhizobium sp. YC-54 TaxID=2986920 RepID=UPI0021F6AF44|nr:oligopeptide/dipeptide ABC transporter ATP-binding protein [Pararhizobium sp. YC-54]MCW0000991.1 ATP-binding cassette domain-containing protein [Pararhizobium sp. YC-54]